MVRGHGGNINTNPLGPAPGLLDYLKENLNAVNVFPQVDSKDLLETFASHHKTDIDVEHIRQACHLMVLSALFSLILCWGCVILFTLSV